MPVFARATAETEAKPEVAKVGLINAWAASLPAANQLNSPHLASVHSIVWHTEDRHLCRWLTTLVFRRMRAFLASSPSQRYVHSQAGEIRL